MGYVLEPAGRSYACVREYEAGAGASKEEAHVPGQVREEHPDDYEVTTSGGDTYTEKLGLVAALEIPE